MDDSPAPRNTLLGSLLRSRQRNSLQPHIITDLTSTEPLPSPTTTSPSSQFPVNPVPSHSVRSTPAQQASPTMNFSSILRRRRSAGQIHASHSSQPPTPSALPSPTAAPAPLPPSVSRTSPSPATANNRTKYRIRLVPHLESRRSLAFSAITRDIRPGDSPIRIGRFTPRSGGGALAPDRVVFKSKVVSRSHAEFWVNPDGTFWIKDVKSSSGTFLNHSRLSPPGTESRAQEIKDGDILQLGVDYQGGTEDAFKSVRIRIEIGREWQEQANAFNTSALKGLKQLASQIRSDGAGGVGGKKKKSSGIGIPDCCICLFAISIHQALFVAPCTHTFHYKCIRPVLSQHHPAFSCPLCRTYADLDEDVEIDADEGGLWKDDDGQESDHPTPAISTPLVSGGPVSPQLLAVEGSAVPGHERELSASDESDVLMGDADDEEQQVVENLVTDAGVSDMEEDVSEFGAGGGAVSDPDATVGGNRKR